MKRNGILNSDISRVLSYMGHTDRIALGDCGLPVPEDVERIDLAIEFGKPSFLEVLRPVAKDMKIEKILLAEEIKSQNPDMLQGILDTLGITDEKQGEIQVEFVPHEEFKRQTGNCKAVIRTGEVTPYANVILQSGCIF